LNGGDVGKSTSPGTRCDYVQLPCQPLATALAIGILLPAPQAGESDRLFPRRQAIGPARFPEEKDMTDKQNEAGVLSVLIQRLESQRLPRLLDIKKSVDEGARLSDYDLHFLQEVLTDAQNVAPMVANHPELGVLASKLTTLYREITETALANEKTG